MNLLNTLLVYLTMVFVSSVQMAPEPTLAPVTPAPSQTVAVVATVTVAASPSSTPTPVPTPAITPNSEYRTLQVGDTGDDVTLMQRRLTELGYYAGTVDGVYGNQSRRAVERFQYYNGLSADGIAGKRTLTVLYESKEVVFAPVDVTPSSSPTPTQTPSPTDTPAPTFAPTPSPTPAPTDTPTPEPTVTEVIATDAALAGETATPETALETTGPTIVAEQETTIPTLAAETAVPTPLTQTDFVMAGSAEPLTLQNDAALALPEPVTLHPLQYGETVMAPILEILRDAGSVILPGTDTVVWEVAFTLNEDLYQFSYQADEAGNVTELTVTKNREPLALTESTGYVFEELLYLPMQTITECLGVTFTPDETATRYTVTLTPVQDAENTEATP
jgi:peptidoglycan hydrolase-like protein with peptidoglycan-binding domain